MPVGGTHIFESWDSCGGGSSSSRTSAPQSPPPPQQQVTFAFRSVQQCGSERVDVQAMQQVTQQQQMNPMMMQQQMNPMMMMMQQQQQMMMGMMGMMMGPMASPMTGAMGMMGGPMAMTMMGSLSGVADETPEEMQHRLGQQVMTNTMRALRNREAADNGDEVDEDGADDVTPGPSSNVQHPNYRPPDMEHIPGLTDRRFEGVVTTWNEQRAYGFVECKDIREKYPNGDVFLHANQRRNFKRGDHVSFNVFLNFKGRPQATELRRRRP